MKQAITAKLKLKTTPEQFKLLRSTQLAYRDALNFVSQFAFEQNKTSNPSKLHDGCYHQIRTRFKLPSQMACSALRDVSATYKGLWTKLMKNLEQRKAGLTKKRFKGLEKAPKFVSPTPMYQYGKDYRFKKNQVVSILTLAGRVVVPYDGYNGRSTRLGDLGAFVRCPRAFGLGCLGKRSQSCTPATVCRSAVDARGKPTAFKRWVLTRIMLLWKQVVCWWIKRGILTSG